MLAVAVHALQLAALRFHPLAVYAAAEVAIQEKPQMFLLMRFGWGLAKNSGGCNSGRKNWGKLNPERYASACVFVPCSTAELLELFPGNVIYFLLPK